MIELGSYAIFVSIRERNVDAVNQIMICMNIDIDILPIELPFVAFGISVISKSFGS